MTTFRSARFPFRCETASGSRWTFVLPDPLPESGGARSKDLEITGTPVVRLFVSSTTEDSAFFAYLEDVDPSGRVLYVTEGHLRALHRAISDEDPPYTMFGPHHSYLSKDAAPMIPGEFAEIAIGLHPTSPTGCAALGNAGERVFISTGDSDADTVALAQQDDRDRSWESAE